MDTLTDTLAEALRDAHRGLRYFRKKHGDLYGVGWNRVQDSADTALAAYDAAKAQPQQPSVRCVDCAEPTGPRAVCESCAGLRCESVAQVVKQPRPSDDELWDQTFKERDHAEEAVSAIFKAVTGRTAEWSNMWNYDDAIEEVAEHVAALQQPAITLRPITDEDAKKAVAAYQSTIGGGGVNTRGLRAALEALLPHGVPVVEGKL